jgi:hypothetical protein
LGAAITVEKVFGYWFYWKKFPAVVGEHKVSGVLALFLFQFAVSLALLYVYDYAGKDVFGIVAIKEQIGKRADQARRFFHRVGRKSGPSIPTWILEFVVAFWQFFPFLALLLIRPGGKPASFLKQFCWLLIGTALTTSFWTSFAVVVNGILRICSW